MTTGQFLQTLYTSGRLVLSSSEAPLSAGRDDAELQAVDRAVRLELAGEGPALAPAVVHWAAKMLHDCCRFYAFRNVDAETIAAALTVACPDDSSCDEAQRAYSADLAFRYLPDLLKLCRGLAPEDPLVAGIIQLAKAWPLSSVGIAEVDNAADLPDSPILDHPALRELYIDRIITREAVGRLRRPAAARLAKAVLGLYPNLAPKTATVLSQEIA
jgi:hypothetical protein